MLLSLGAVAAITDRTGAQSGAPETRLVFQHDLPDLNLSGWSATAVEVAYGPGESSPPHRHPGLTIAYVLEGSIRSKVGDEPEQTYSAGQMFLETPGQLHAVSRNASSSQLLTRKGEPLSTPMKPPPPSDAYSRTELQDVSTRGRNLRKSRRLDGLDQPGLTAVYGG